MEFNQPWLGQPESGFRPGHVRFGWRLDPLLYRAHLEDADVSTAATSRNQPLWQLGDVLELFACATGEPRHVAYHIAPNGFVLQLLWPDASAHSGVRDSEDLKRFVVTDDNAATRTRLVEGGWEVYGELPASALSREKVPLKGQSWQVSFGRYDYHADGTFTLSSTSKLTRPSYHRRHEWMEILFQ